MHFLRVKYIFNKISTNICTNRTLNFTGEYVLPKTDGSVSRKCPNDREGKSLLFLNPSLILKTLFCLFISLRFHLNLVAFKVYSNKDTQPDQSMFTDNYQQFPAKLNCFFFILRVLFSHFVFIFVAQLDKGFCPFGAVVWPLPFQSATWYCHHDASADVNLLLSALVPGYQVILSHFR